MCAWSVRLRANAPARMRTYPPPSVRDPQCPNSPPFSGIGVSPRFVAPPLFVASEQCCGSGIRCLLGPWIRNPVPIWHSEHICVEISSRFSVLQRKSPSLKWGLFKLFLLFFLLHHAQNQGAWTQNPEFWFGSIFRIDLTLLDPNPSWKCISGSRRMEIDQN